MSCPALGTLRVSLVTPLEAGRGRILEKHGILSCWSLLQKSVQVGAPVFASGSGSCSSPLSASLPEMVALIVSCGSGGLVLSRMMVSQCLGSVVWCVSLVIGITSGGVG